MAARRGLPTDEGYPQLPAQHQVLKGRCVMAKRIPAQRRKAGNHPGQVLCWSKQNMRDTQRSLGLKRPGNKVVRTAARHRWHG